jgi:hypothetical protein
MLRHGCGYAFANAGHDTRALKAWLGHRNIQHTVRQGARAGSRDAGGRVLRDSTATGSPLLLKMAEEWERLADQEERATDRRQESGR